ncbi:Glyceraldehyde 3-phosphate dehydrogenase [Shewanella piezotolerans WP3]|uniref:Glyceraldehyde 3-phosphate dehydrogenase n=1 Tax=Shewanella piezotolerans (strain WP3 / JCM 13877) TaxID=225849 RepID=B8CKK3_SHEPW|nr:BamA/TamA family outer membrane protein [Shewanella piezotolerans]ACJ28042.1 Glyceraldehyde 3-phosphate dehydrogenase [Shewanella piezotolerans WP3]
MNISNIKLAVKTATLSALSLLMLPNIASASFMDGFKDPIDGRIDASQWILDNSAGFMPIPLIITEPAVGTGGGAALLFFHETEEQKALREQNPEQVSEIPPSVTGVVGAATSNGSSLAGVFHSGNWENDNIRYLGGIFGADFNLQYYQEGSEQANKFNIKGLYFFQDIDFRLGNSNFFIGADYVNMSSEASFDLSPMLPGVDPLALDSTDAHLGLKLTYDSRDNQFAPRSGTKAGMKANMHGKGVGGDFDYQDYHVFVQSYHRLAHKWGVAIRLDAQSTTDGAPFYAKPYIDMRGMAAMRYQADNTALAEVEVSYDIDDRWTVLGFAGSGKAVNNDQSFNQAKWQNAQGGGFRYLIARQLGLRTGVDIAKGPEEWTVYLQFGGAW